MLVVNCFTIKITKQQKMFYLNIHNKKQNKITENETSELNRETLCLLLLTLTPATDSKNIETGVNIQGGLACSVSMLAGNTC